MQTQTIMRHRCVFTSKAVVGQTQCPKRWWWSRALELSFSTVRNVEWYSHVGKDCGGFFKWTCTCHMTCLRLTICQEGWNHPHQSLSMRVHSSFLCNSPRLEIDTHVSINRWRLEQVVVYPYSGLELSARGWVSDTGSHVEECSMHDYRKWELREQLSGCLGMGSDGLQRNEGWMDDTRERWRSLWFQSSWWLFHSYATMPDFPHAL